jgi:hypothetical protein
MSFESFENGIEANIHSKRLWVSLVMNKQDQRLHIVTCFGYPFYDSLTYPASITSRISSFPSNPAMYWSTGAL